MDLNNLIQSMLSGEESGNDSEETKENDVKNVLLSLLDQEGSQKASPLANLPGSLKPDSDLKEAEQTDSTAEESFGLAGLLESPATRDFLVKLLSEKFDLPGSTIKSILDTVAPAKKKRATTTPRRKTTKKPADKKPKKTTSKKTTTRKTTSTGKSQKDDKSTPAKKKKTTSTRKSSSSSVKKTRPKTSSTSSASSSSSAKKKSTTPKKTKRTSTD